MRYVHITLIAIIVSVFPFQGTAHADVASYDAPSYVQSHYMTTANETTLYDIGYELGQEDLKEAGTQNPLNHFGFWGTIFER